MGSLLPGTGYTSRVCDRDVMARAFGAPFVPQGKQVDMLRLPGDALKRAPTGKKEECLRRGFFDEVLKFACHTGW